MELAAKFLEHGGPFGLFCVAEFAVIVHLYRENRKILDIHIAKAEAQAKQLQEEAAASRALTAQNQALLQELANRVRTPRK